MSPSNNENALPPSYRGQPQEYASSSSSSWKNTTTTAATMMLPQISGLVLKSALGITVALYVLNQTHMLPKPIAAVVSKFLFYPTLPITASKRIGKWVTRIDDTLLVGGAPFTLLDYPRKLKDDYGVQGVINMCEEWRGPMRHYKQLGIEELYLPTTDHFEPSQEDLITALSFIKRHEAQGKSVYVHCRAGHGRSGAVAFAWLLLKQYQYNPTTTSTSGDDVEVVVNLEKLNADLRKIRKVRPNLWKQPNISALHNRLIRSKGSLVDLNDDFFKDDDDDVYEKKRKEKEIKKDL